MGKEIIRPTLPLLPDLEGEVSLTEGLGLQAAGEEKKPLLSLSLGLAVKVASLLLLTRLFGEIGVPLSTVLFFITVSLVNLGQVKRTVGMRIRFVRTFLKPALAAFLPMPHCTGLWPLYRGSRCKAKQSIL